MRDTVDIGAEVGKPRLVSMKDRNGDMLIDAASAFDRARRYDSHRVAARLMATRIPPVPRGPMATRPGPAEFPPARYDFDDLAPARGIVVSAIIVAFVAFVLALVFVS